MTDCSPISFRAARFDRVSFFFTGLTGVATWLILAILVVILINIAYQGGQHLSWRFITGGQAHHRFYRD